MNEQEKIEEILFNQEHSERWKYDELLAMDADMYTMLGTDSTKTERNRVKKISRKIYQAIKSLNCTISEGKNISDANRLGQSFMSTMDGK